MTRFLPAACLLSALAVAGCASSGAVPKPFPGARGAPGVPGETAPPTAPRASRAAVAPAVVETALKFRGVPYRNGGSDPSGFDCSGFVQYVFAQHGVPLPREVREQFGFGNSVTKDQIRAGDLIFFSTVTKGASHVGVAIGGDEFVHAPSSRGSVRIERFTARYWSDRIVGVKRVR